MDYQMETVGPQTTRSQIHHMAAGFRYVINFGGKFQSMVGPALLDNPAALSSRGLVEKSSFRSCMFLVYIVLKW